jgi:hypothetical protein
MVVRVENDNTEVSLHEMKALFLDEDVPAEKIRSGSKFNISMEKKIERIWHESRNLGWSFNAFSVGVLEVLIILHHRNKLPAPDRPVRKLAYKSRA